MPMDRFRAGLKAAGCEILSELVDPDDHALAGRLMTVRGPFKSKAHAREVVAEAKIAAYRGHLLLSAPPEDLSGTAMEQVELRCGCGHATMGPYCERCNGFVGTEWRDVDEQRATPVA